MSSLSISKPGLACALFLLAPCAARGEEVDRAELVLEVQWLAGAESCGGTDALRDAIAARLGYDAFTSDGPATLHVEIGREREWRALLRLERGAEILGERELSSRARACESFLADVALAASVALDAYAQAREEAPEVEAPPADPPAGNSAPSIPGMPIEPAPVIAMPPAEPRVAIGFMVLGSWGAVPDITAGALISGYLRWTHASVGLEWRADIPRSIAAGAGSVLATIFFASAHGCFHYEFFAACAAVGAGGLYGEGIDLLDAASVLTAYAVAGGSVRAHVPIRSELAFVARFDVLATLLRTTLRVDDRPAWTAEPISLALAAGIEFFP